MNTTELAKICQTLGNPDRVTFMDIMKKYPGGLTLRELLTMANYPPDSLQSVRRHLHALARADLVTATSIGQTLHFRINYDGVRRLIALLGEYAR